MNDKSTKWDLYQNVTDRIITSLEEGCAPWVKPWSVEACTTDIPINGHSRRAYRGINTLLLWLTQSASGFTSREWFTFKQAQEEGGYIRRYEKATLVVFWKQIEVDDPASDKPGATKQVPVLRYYHVFNRDQIDDLTAEQPTPKCAWDPVERAENLVAASGAKVTHLGSSACYLPGPDLIRMPVPASFKSAADYYATQLHELTHWTGHASRLARKYGERFGDTAYAREELVAEMGSAFLCAAVNIVGKLQHPEYVHHWLLVLRSDKRAVFTAASHAQKAADFLLEKLEENSELGAPASSADNLPQRQSGLLAEV